MHWRVNATKVFAVTVAAVGCYENTIPESSESGSSTFILKVINGGLGEAKQVVLGHTASKWQSGAAKLWPPTP